MRPLAALFSASLALSACAPLSIYHRSGVPVSQMQSDQINCEVRALKDAPVANQIRQGPPIFFSGRQICGASRCYYGSGHWVDGAIRTVDVNADLRRRVKDQCMATKGYQPVTVPLCSGAVRSAVADSGLTGQTRTLPRLTPNACAIRHGDGSWQIVNPIIRKSGG